MTDRRLGFALRASRTALIWALMVAMIYPLAWMFASSFKDNADILTSASVLPEDLNLESYVRGWSGLQISFGRFFVNSAIVAALSVIGNLFSCSFAAYAFARLEFRGRQLWFALMLGTLMVPYHVTLIPQYILFNSLGWINSFLPLVVPKFLAVDAFFIFLMVQFFRTIPRELDEAAKLDGCGAWGVYRRVILPLSIPVLATAAIFTFVFTWDDFFGPLIYLHDMPLYTVQVALRSFVDTESRFDLSALFAMSTLVVAPVFLLFLFFQRYLIEGIATTGLRG